MSAARFTFELPNAGCGPVDKAIRPEAMVQGAVPQAAVTAGVVPPPPQLPYAHDLGM